MGFGDTRMCKKWLKFYGEITKNSEEIFEDISKQRELPDGCWNYYNLLISNQMTVLIASIILCNRI